jgi:hypothetical protein
MPLGGGRRGLARGGGDRECGHQARDRSDDRPQADQHEADHGQGATAALVILHADDTPDAQRYRDESETGTGGDQRKQRDRVQRWFRRRAPVVGRDLLGRRRRPWGWRPIHRLRLLLGRRRRRKCLRRWRVYRLVRLVREFGAHECPPVTVLRVLGGCDHGLKIRPPGRCGRIVTRHPAHQGLRAGCALPGQKPWPPAVGAWQSDSQRYCFSHHLRVAVGSFVEAGKSVQPLSTEEEPSNVPQADTADNRSLL